jgi:hypothetical protein
MRVFRRSALRAAKFSRIKMRATIVSGSTDAPFGDHGVGAMSKSSLLLFFKKEVLSSFAAHVSSSA